jgi:hypothetical protein
LSGTVVLDTSTALAEAVLVALEGQTVLLPALWSLEVANALLAGERRKPLRQPEILRFLEPANYRGHANSRRAGPECAPHRAGIRAVGV